MLDIILAIAPVFIIIAVGALSKYLGLGNDKWINVLNKFALYIAFPALIFSSLAGLESRGIINYSLFIYTAVLLLIMMGIIYIALLFFKIPKEIRNCYLLCAVLGNVAYLGFPYVNSLLPDAGADISIVIATYIIINFTVGLWILEAALHKRAKIIITLKNILKNPLMLAVIFGVIFAHFQLRLPFFLDRALELLGNGASPVVLFSLGLFIMKKIQFNKKLVHAIVLSALKLLVLPALFLLAGAYFIRDFSFNISMIEAGMPVAITLFALSELYPMDKTIVVYTIIISTVLSVITLPILTALVL